MPTRVLHFDVFTSKPGKGNPAGIVLSEDRFDKADMQAIASSTGFNDTAFVTSSRKANYRIRYFSPREEIDLCGHATIAASIALHTRGLLSSKTLPCTLSLEAEAGILSITIDANETGETIVFMSQPAPRFQIFTGDKVRLLQALGLSNADLNSVYPIIYGSTGRWTLIVPVRGLEAMRHMHPRTARFPEALVDMPGASIHPFCIESIGKDVHMHARHFSAPTSSIVEDPVTGTASGVLGAYYYEFIDRDRDSSQPLVVEQGYEVGREGRVLVWAVRDHGGYAVRIAGTACFVDERSYF